MRLLALCLIAVAANGQIPDYESATRTFRNCSELAGRNNDKLGEARCQVTFGRSLMQIEKPAEAQGLFEQAAETFRQLGDESGHSDAQLALSSVFFRARKFPESEKLCLAVLEKGTAEYEATAHFMLASTYQAWNKYDNAIRHYQQALALAEKRSDEALLSQAQSGIARVYFGLNDHAVALKFGEQSLKLKEKLKTHEGLANTLDLLAIASASLGKMAEARSYFERAIEEIRRVRDQASLARILMNYGVLLSREKDHVKAIPIFEDCIRVATELNQQTYLNFARVNLANSLTAQKRQTEGMMYSRAALDYAKKTNWLQMIFMAGDTLAYAADQLGRYEEAEGGWRDAIASVEEQLENVGSGGEVRVRFMNDKEYVYDRLVELLHKEGRTADAFAVAERAKARVILDAIRGGRAGLDTVLTPEERSREAELRKKHRSDRGEKARLEYRAFLTALYASHPEMRAHRLDIEPVAPDTVINAVPPDAALIEFVAGHPEVRMFVITRNASGGADTRMYKLNADHDTLTKKVETFAAQVASRDLAFPALARELYKTLIEPAAEQLQGRNTLILVPDHYLWRLPFQALQSGPNRYLLEDRAVLYVPSLTLLNEMMTLARQHPAAIESVVALGAADVPGSQREVMGLRGIYGALHTRLFVGAEADVRNLREGAVGADILHLSAHGVFRDDDPLSSYLMLAQRGKPETAKFEARELMALRTNARVVVLSGCETGKGEEGGGDGIIGMTWALFVAGSSTTVASQWKVDADSTSELMLGFHRALHKNRSPAGALREAAVNVMKQPRYRHPFYWSGFTVIGRGI